MCKGVVLRVSSILQEVRCNPTILDPFDIWQNCCLHIAFEMATTKHAGESGVRL